MVMSEGEEKEVEEKRWYLLHVLSVAGQESWGLVGRHVCLLVVCFN